MLPSICPQTPPGEHELFVMLRDDPGCQGWTVLHSLDIAEHVRQMQGEADFVVLIPDEGIVVLEVKSHERIICNERGWWLGNNASPEKRGPFRQASDALHSIKEFLDNQGLAESVPMVSACAFPSAPFKTNSPEWHGWQVLDRQAIHARPISVNLLNVIHKAREHFVQKGLFWAGNGIVAPPDKLDRIAALLRPRFEIMASPAARRENLEKGLLSCTEEQFRFLDSCRGDRTLVSGLAGTGKTTLALEMIRRAKVANPDLTVGLFCYNSLLGKKLEEECAGLSGPTRVGTFHEWMLNYSGLSVGAGNDFWNRVLPAAVLEKLTMPGLDPAILDLLVLDEAQDLFLDAYLDIFDLLLKGGLKSGRWFFFGDFERQDIFAKGDVGREAFLDKRLAGGRCNDFYLGTNCRNTREIAQTLTLLANLNPGYSGILRPDTRRDPELRFYPDADGQRGLLEDAIDQLLSEGFKAGEIVLLSPLREGSAAVALGEAGRWKGRIGEFKNGLKSDMLRYATIQSFKGMEAPAVVLTDIDRLDNKTHQDLFYTGMSRALHRLVLLCNEAVKKTLMEQLQ